jgi:hypothetical protein
MPCELLTTGWYASTESRDYRTSGDDLIRGAAFRPLWWKSVDTFIRPKHVFVVDSASPVKANDSAFTSTDCQHLELLINPGHSQNTKNFYSGWSAGIILGLEYALHCGVDMFLYVEQDVLVYGHDIIDRTQDALRSSDLVFGAGTFVDVQQSFVAANKRGIRKFLSALHAINYSDKQIAPEHKFMFAASRFLPSSLLALAEFREAPKLRRAGLLLYAAACSLSKNYAVLPFGYGRARPINFNDDAFYFQHGTEAEVAQYRRLTGF